MPSETSSTTTRWMVEVPHHPPTSIFPHKMTLPRRVTESVRVQNLGLFQRFRGLRPSKTSFTTTRCLVEVPHHPPTPFLTWTNTLKNGILPFGPIQFQDLFQRLLGFMPSETSSTLTGYLVEVPHDPPTPSLAWNINLKNGNLWCGQLQFLGLVPKIAWLYAFRNIIYPHR